MSLSVHIKKKLGDFLLQIDLEHPEGVTGLLGASGCGKSITLKCIAGIVKPDEGQILLNGKVLFDSEKRINLRPQERGVGYLFQNYALFPNMTVEQNIRCGLCKEKNKNIKKEKAEEALALMELKDQRKLYPHQLSGGQQQRTALARMLVSEPELLLLDEPFSALDSYLREQLQTQVRGILERFGKDVLMVSHSRDEVYYLCNEVAVMSRGKILNKGKTKEIFANPGSRTAAVLTARMPVEDDLCAVGLRAHYFNPKAKENLFPVVYSDEREDPFETRLLFRYAAQKKGTPDIWWRMPKDRRPAQMPQYLGIASSNVLLLYPEERKTL